MNVPGHLAPFWQLFTKSRPEDPIPRFCAAFHFDDNEQSANELGQLVVAGTKRATASLLWCYEAASEPIPQAGDISVVTNWAKMPLCAIQTESVNVVAFDEVSAEFAALEGEGDGSLQYWKETHWAYFGRECQRIGCTPQHNMPVVCERFEVVFRPPAILTRIS